MTRARPSVLGVPDRVALALAITAANLAGAVVVLVLAVWVLPEGAAR